ncbi:hypothetical protein B0T22DRAFT_177996 [Podospora appendiculata]|uniref:Peptidase metallopeptidase domain-containing protein n=1 Tax=Podospora appendiculata TaxID=314037 RepID=A0AAE1CDJ0_9PEZI|nr:hypothetical protein B0T22DRAFT_177996 [Podospora appendiculata]
MTTNNNDVLDICMDTEDDEGYVQILSLPDTAAASTAPMTRDVMCLCADKDRLWGQPEVTVAFLDEFPNDIVEEDVKQMIEAIAHEWTDGTRIRFRFIADPAVADIRISNKPGGSYSRVGNAARLARAGAETMNLDLPRDASARKIQRKAGHEFGHALGFIHEQSSAAYPFRFDEQKTLAHYAAMGYAEGWVRNNILKRIKAQYADASPYDCLSIMHYPIPKEIHDGAEDVHARAQLSVVDKLWVKAVYGEVSPVASVTDEANRAARRVRLMIKQRSAPQRKQHWEID